jgi:hypothetical protein
MGEACSGKQSAAASAARGLVRAKRLPPARDRDRRKQPSITDVSECDEMVRDVTARMVQSDHQVRRRRRVFVATGLLVALAVTAGAAWLFARVYFR